ncbi:hypothetical protein HK105_202438 [Polyrhizophydium stewartii]|uniref:t-SNARE coiled-coil homology domain-containing protein n=1 Tax=Polyrhizophydium stewartii TaxID=2732419 RepID=A0ABR4NER3_9FUNG
MSFADFGTGTASPRLGAGSGPLSAGLPAGQRAVHIPLNTAGSSSPAAPSADSGAAFRRLWDSVSNSIFQISSNTATIQRLLGLFGGPRDTPEMRQQLHDVTERTRSLIKTTTADLKKVMAFVPSDQDRQVRITQKKLQKDFEEVLRRFQEASKVAAEKSREFVARARTHQALSISAEEDAEEDEPLLGRAQQLSQLRVLDAEVEFNEALIAEREQDLVGIEQSIQEVNEIFRDLGTLVNQQQHLLDNIETNVDSVAINVEGAHSELRTANGYQERRQSFMCWIFIALLVEHLIHAFFIRRPELLLFPLLDTVTLLICELALVVVGPGNRSLPDMAANPFVLKRQLPGSSDSYAFQVAAAPTQTHFAAPRATGGITIHDAATLDQSAALAAGGPDTVLSQVMFDSANPSLLLAGSHDGLVRLWDLRNGATVLTWNAHAPVLSFDVNCTHTLMAVGTELVGEDAKIHFWDVRAAGGTLLASFEECHSDDVTQIKFHPTQAEAMVSGSTDGLICLYNLSTFEEDDAIYQIIKNDSISKLGYFGPSYEYIYATTHMETFSLWRFLEGEKIYTFGDVRGISEELKLDYLIDCTYDAASQRLFVLAGSQEGSIGVLDVGLGNLQLAYTLNGGHTDIVRAAHWRLETGSLISASEDGSLCLWQQ